MYIYRQKYLHRHDMYISTYTCFFAEEVPLVISPLEAAQQAKQLIELKADQEPGRCEGGKSH